MASSAVAAEPAWLKDRRSEAEARLETLELPTKKAKGWEFTELKDLDLGSYDPAPSSAEISGGGDSVVVMRLEDALQEHGELIAGKLGSLVPGDDIFAAGNDAAWAEGAFIYVPAGVTAEETIKIDLDIDTPAGAVNWRTLVVLEDGAEAEVWENYGSSTDETDALLNSVVELSVGQAAKLRYISTQDLSQKAWLFATQRAQIERDARLDWAALGFGSGRGKVRMETKLAGEGSEARVTGGYAGNGDQHLDYDTTQEHAAAHTFSDLAFRGVLSESSTSVWRGIIKVDKGAQQTDAFQESRNLILDSTAHADAIPGLEILADDVRCTHAAAIAQIDKDQIFYLTSRGLPFEEARTLVIEGFLQALVERIEEGDVREEVSAALERRLDEILT